MSKLEQELREMPKWRQDNIIHNHKVNGCKKLRSRYKIIKMIRYKEQKQGGAL